jgi:glycosyltransferase involved in cell wall biosynthesis
MWMRIHLYTLSWNEKAIMPFFLAHYGKYCEKIVVYDNESTDETPEIVRSFPNAELRSWSSGNTFHDGMHLDIKNSAYKESRGKADWVVVCDADEFLYHPNLVQVLASYKAKGINYPKIRGYEMLPERMPESGEDLCLKYRRGARYENLDKRAIFDPSLDINFHLGSHDGDWPRDAVESPEADIILMHYKMLSLDYFIARHTLLATRLSDFNKEKGAGGHYLWSKSRMEKTYNGFRRRRVNVVPFTWPRREMETMYLMYTGLRRKLKRTIKSMLKPRRA